MALDRQNADLDKVREEHTANEKKLDETVKVLSAEETPKSINLHVNYKDTVFNFEEIEKTEKYILYLKKQKDSTVSYKDLIKEIYSYYNPRAEIVLLKGVTKKLRFLQRKTHEKHDFYRIFIEYAENLKKILENEKNGSRIKPKQLKKNQEIDNKKAFSQT